jgi:hypothetical protein
MRAVKAFTQGIDRARPDVSIDDPEGRQAQQQNTAIRYSLFAIPDSGRHFQVVSFHFALHWLI